MTITGSGVGGNIGGPMQPTQRDIETTAWTMVNKAALGIMPDTLEVPFSQLGGNVWKYQSDANRPTLKPLATFRMTAPDELVPDDSWKSSFDALVGKLHPQLKNRLLANMGKPFSARSMNYSVFENVLTMTAKGLAWLQKAQEPLDPESPAWERTEHNQALPGKALRGIVGHARTMLMGTKAFLNYVGPNHPHYEALNHFANQGADVQGELNRVLEQIQNEEQPDPQVLNNLANKATFLSNRFNSIAHGQDMQMMGPLFEAMAAVANALSVTPTSPSLFFGLKLATTGLFSKESQAGLLGAQFETLMKALTKGSLSTLMNKVSHAKQMMLMMMLLGMTSGASTLAALISEFGAGRFPSEGDGEEAEGHVFTFQLLLQLLAKSGLLNLVCKILTETTGANEKAQEMMTSIMELTTLLLMALSGTKGQPKEAGILLEGIKTHLGEHIDKIEKFVLSLILEGIENSATAKGLNVALKQAKIALETENFEALVGSCGNALDLLGTTPDLLLKDLRELKEFAKLVNRSCVPEARTIPPGVMSRSG